MTDSERERTLDRRISSRLYTDHAYRNAASATKQAIREEEIEAEEVARLDAEIEHRRLHREGIPH